MQTVHILSGIAGKGGNIMRESDDYTVDIEDLLYEEDEGGPSER